MVRHQQKAIASSLTSAVHWYVKLKSDIVSFFFLSRTNALESFGSYGSTVRLVRCLCISLPLSVWLSCASNSTMGPERVSCFRCKENDQRRPGSRRCRLLPTVEQQMVELPTKPQAAALLAITALLPARTATWRVRRRLQAMSCLRVGVPRRAACQLN